MLTFAGEPLLFPTAELDAWMARNQELCDLGQFASVPAETHSARHACRSRFEQNKGLGLPVVNWPAPPPPRLNTLYWPTGATRWAMGWFCCTTEVRDRIIDKVHSSSGNNPGVLGIGDDLDGSSITPVNAISMYMLTPRPMTKGDDSDLDVWLIPLVDERYFWQYANFGDNTVSTSTTWESLIATLGTQLGVSITIASNIESNYLKPDPVDFSRRYDNAAMLLEAAAWSTARRVVRRIDGSVLFQSRSIADSDLRANLRRAAKMQLLAGGDFGIIGGDQPRWLEVTWRKIYQHLLRSDNQLYSSRLPAIDGTVNVADREFTIHCAALADFDAKGDSVPNNSTTLALLSSRLTIDYFGWQATNYDRTYAGIVDWRPTAYDDAILWSFGRLSPDKGFDLIRDDEGKLVGLGPLTEHLAYTRVQTLPPNTWPEVNLCSDSTKEVVEPRLMAIASDGDIEPGEAGEVTLYDSLTHSLGKTVELTNISGVTWGDGLRGWAEGIGDAEWLGTPSECDS